MALKKKEGKKNKKEKKERERGGTNEKEKRKIYDICGISIGGFLMD